MKQKLMNNMIAITKELTETLRKNKSIDWQKRESARAKMRMLIKKLLRVINIHRKAWKMLFKLLWFNVSCGLTI